MMSNLPEFAPLQKGQPSNVEHKQQMDTIMEELKVLNNKVRALFVSVLVGIVVLIIVIAVLFVNFNSELKNHSHAPKVGEQISKMLNRENEELCVPCDNLRLGPSIEEDRFLDKLTRKDDPKGEQCCVESPKQLLDMLNLFIERRYREEMAKGNIKLSNEDSPGDKENVPAAHMMGSIKSNVPSRVPGKQITIGEWIFNRDLGFIQRAKYRHGRIVIPSTGVYFIYSQVSFLEVVDIKQGNSKPPSTTSPSLSHYLYRYNLIYPHGGEETLIQNSITKCWGHNKSFGEYTSYLGAVFQLRQGDEIFVKVSNLTLLTNDPKSNYFGLFKIN
ncbi:tumor necrosis factor ligand superfamily member 10 [Octopus sinensis]|uniref:Tumor necrosis factor ligand superfamily member 10 n=1 Tax=Octopus sinensis TaxID=2607531 RepID=A0A6P7S5S6_9MOLL|nr:tumor necrosis factor ligand superfamily member 10 [Octopus sinensis]